MRRGAVAWRCVAATCSGACAWRCGARFRGTGVHAFSRSDEEALVRVLNTHPEHVARYVRQDAARAHKRELALRETVTRLVTLVQEQLQEQRLRACDAVAMLEGVMHECESAAQHDMTHLLFRALVRFRAHGCHVSPDAAHCAFAAYRASDSATHMRQLADDLRDGATTALLPLALAAYAAAACRDEVDALLPMLSSSHAWNRRDVLAVVHGIGKLDGDVTALVQCVLAACRAACDGDASPSAPLARGDVCEVYVQLLRVLDARDDAANFDVVVQQAQLLLAPVPTPLLAAVLRRRLRHVQSTHELARVERELHEMGYDSDLVCDAMLVTAHTRLLRFGDKSTEAGMLAKTHALLAAVEARLRTSAQQRNDSDDDDDGDKSDVHVTYVCAVLRGFGAADKRDAMRDAWARMRRAAGDAKSAAARCVYAARVYNEMLKWHAVMGNVADALALKAEMDAACVCADAWTYTWLLRALDRYYPHHVEQLYAELQQRQVRCHVYLYNTLLAIFGDLRRDARVGEVVAALRAREAASTLQLTPTTFATLIRISAHDVASAQAWYDEATRRNMHTHPHVQTSMLHVLAQQRDAPAAPSAEQQQQQPRLDAFLATLPTPYNIEVYNVLLHMYSMRDDRPAFDALLQRMTRDGAAMDDVTHGTLLTAYSRWRDGDAVRQVVQRLRAGKGTVRADFYAVLGASLCRLQRGDGADWAWDELCSSGLMPTTRVYSHFLRLFSRQRDLARVQRVLDAMMQHVPPNTITVTTVVDMLGKLGRTGEMAALFDDMKRTRDAQPTAVTFHHVMNAYAKKGYVAQLEAVYTDYRAAGHTDTAVTYNIRMECYSRARDLHTLELLRAERAQRGVAADDIMYCILVIAYGRAKRDEDVTRLLDELVATSASADTTLLTGRVLWSCIDAFSRCGNVAGVDRCVEWLRTHRRDTTTAAATALTAHEVERLVPYYCAMASMERVEQLIARLGDAPHEQLHAEAATRHVRQHDPTDDDVTAAAAVVCDNDDAQPQQHVVAGRDNEHEVTLSYALLNCIACGYARTGRLDKVVEYLHKLRDRHWVPDAKSAMQLSTAFLRAGLHVQAQQILEWRRQYMRAARDVGDAASSQSTMTTTTTTTSA